jgi:hypothetical protein
VVPLFKTDLWPLRNLLRLYCLYWHYLTFSSADQSSGFVILSKLPTQRVVSTVELRYWSWFALY